MFCYGRLEDYERVVQDATWLIEHGFVEASIYEWRGWAKYIMGNLEGAIEDYSRILDSTPDGYSNRISRASLYYKSHRYDEALKDLDHALKFAIREMDTDKIPSFIVYQYRAMVFYQRGELEKSFYEYNYAQVLVGFKPFASVESYVASIKDGLAHSFSGMPSRPSDRSFLTRRGTPKEIIV
jgi:tetratricopeptide (TPR) repeat protein